MVAAGLGVVSFLLVCFGWSWIRDIYREFLAKCAVAIFRLIAAVSAVTAKVASPEAGVPLWEQPWATTVLIAATGYLFWEVAGAIGDHKSKLSKEKTLSDHKREIEDLINAHQQELSLAKQDRDDAEFEALRLNWLLTHLRRSVSEKRQRVRREALANIGVRPTIQQARNGLAPDDQIQILLELLASLFHYEAVQGDFRQHNQNFRVGLFTERNGRLEPLGAFDLNTRDHEPFSSFEQYADRYRLDNDTNPSHAVRCVREGRTIIVPDCAAEPGFEFFNEKQRKHLKSMVAYPLSGFCPDGVNPARAALLIDTDKPGFFSEEDREMVELLINEFVLRISLEYAISRLTGSQATQKGGGDE